LAIVFNWKTTAVDRRLSSYLMTPPPESPPGKDESSVDK